MQTQQEIGRHNASADDKVKKKEKGNSSRGKVGTSFGVSTTIRRTVK